MKKNDERFDKALDARFKQAVGEAQNEFWVPADNLTDDQILNHVRTLHEEKQNLVDFPVKSTKVEAQVKEKQAAIDALIKLVDER